MGGEHGGQVEQIVDIQCGVDQPGFGQRPARPVVRRVCLPQLDAQLGLEEGAEGGSRLGEKPCGQFGVEDARGDDVDLLHARQVLRGSVHDPGGAAAGVDQGTEVRPLTAVLEGDGIDQPGACALAPDLQEVGLRPVAMPVGALGVERHGSPCGAQGGEAFVE